MNFNKKVSKFNTLTGKKIWEISEIYHSFIIGTCLTITEMKLILKKHGVEIGDNLSKYETYSVMMAFISAENSISHDVQLILDNKYENTCKKIYEVEDERLIYAYWKELADKGEFSDGFWSIVSHPHTSYEFTQIVYKEFYVLSYDILSLFPKNNVNFEHLIKQRVVINNLLKETKLKLNQRNTDIKALRSENLFLKTKILEMESKYKEKMNDYLYLDDFFSQEIEKDGIKSCDENCDSCEYQILDKKILYIGGIDSTIVQCKHVVEENDGIFQHHDGGSKDSISDLHKMLTKADIVFCPIKNISYSTVYIVKEICRKHNKELVFLKNSRFSSFLKELTVFSKAV